MPPCPSDCCVIERGGAVHVLSIGPEDSRPEVKPVIVWMDFLTNQGSVNTTVSHLPLLNEE